VLKVHDPAGLAFDHDDVTPTDIACLHRSNTPGGWLSEASAPVAAAEVENTRRLPKLQSSS